MMEPANGQPDDPATAMAAPSEGGRSTVTVTGASQLHEGQRIVTGRVTWAMIRKCWLETRWLLGGLVILMAALFWMRVWLISRLDSGRFQQILELLPDGIRSMTRVDFDWIVTYTGRLSMGFEEPMVVLVMAIWAISRGSDVVAGELSRGTMEMMLAQPVSRARAFWVPVGYALLGIGLLALTSLVGTALGIGTIQANEAYYPSLPIPFFKDGIPLPFLEAQTVKVPMSELVTVTPFWPAALNLFSLGVFILGAALAFSAQDRHRWRAIGSVTIVLIVMSLIKVMAMSHPAFQWLMGLTAFSAYEPALFVQQSQTDPESLRSLWFYDAKDQFRFSHWVYHGTLLVLGFGLTAWASWRFRHRDLPAPL